MKNILTIVMITLFVLIICCSGCIKNTNANSTWGEKKISLDAIKITNNTTGNYNEQNESRYYVNGWIENGNPYDATKVKISVTTYYANGTVFAVNDTPYLQLNHLPANGKSYFYARFYDPDKKIARYDVKILDAKAEYWA